MAVLVIGLSGPIGCGKSTVAAMLADVGGHVIDADALAHRVTEPGMPALDEIRARFGDGVIDADGALDRGTLGHMVFSDPRALADLELIVHPHVRRLVEAELLKAESELAPFVVVEAIKLVEGGLAARCDEVWLIECAPGTQRDRLARRGVDQATAEQRIAAQGADLVDRLAAALGERQHRRLATDGALAEVRERVEDALADAISRSA